jgi:uncharacterized metal-binding protein YceD (DUF177 family)
MTVEATEEERAALAGDFDLPVIHALSGRFRLTGSPALVRVTGRVEASITQTCVVTLEPFDSRIEEDVEVDFAVPGAASRPSDPEGGADAPDEIVDGRIDLGALTAEFLALGLDPYPRKPGVAFEHQRDDMPDSPFSALQKLKQGG